MKSDCTRPRETTTQETKNTHEKPRYNTQKEEHTENTLETGRDTGAEQAYLTKGSPECK